MFPQRVKISNEYCALSVQKGKYNKKLIIAPRKPRVHSSNRGSANDQVMTGFRSVERVYLIVRKISSALYGF